MNINRVVMTGNLTRDPELRTTGGGLAICKLRIACNTRRKNGATGEWEDRPNYFDVTVFGGQGESASRFLSKGRPVAIDGRLAGREYEVDGQKRQAVDIIADSVQFLGGRDDAGSGNGFSGTASAGGESDVPIDTGDFEPARVPAGAADDDIPF
jgi:single-strand DNA-binding protein